MRVKLHLRYLILALPLRIFRKKGTNLLDAILRPATKMIPSLVSLRSILRLSPIF